MKSSANYSNKSTTFATPSLKDKSKSAEQPASASQNCTHNATSLFFSEGELLLSEYNSSPSGILSYLSLQDLKSFSEVSREAYSLSRKLTGPTRTLKITNPADLKDAAKLIKQREAEGLGIAAINLEGPNFTDQDLKALQGLSSIKSVMISDCRKITDTGLSYIGHATQINLIDCCQITDAGLAHFRNANHVSLEGCLRITDAGLAHLRNATHVNLGGCDQITDEGLFHLRNAIQVGLRNCCRITDDGLIHLRNTKHITLKFTEYEGVKSEITDAGISNFQNANYVHLSRLHNVRGGSLASLHSLTEVRFKPLERPIIMEIGSRVPGTHLNFSGCLLQDFQLDHFVNATHVDLSFNHQLTADGIRRLGNATHINLSHCAGTTDESLFYLSHATHLNLSFSVEITDKGVEHLHNAAHLDLSNCGKITGSGFANLKNLKQVKLYSCSTILDQHLIHLRNATHIDLSFCKQLTNAGFAHLSKASHIKLVGCQINDKGLSYLTNAKQVDLTLCPNVTDNGLYHLRNAEAVNLSFCDKITDEGFKYLQNCGVRIIAADISHFKFRNNPLSYDPRPVESSGWINYSR